MAKFINLKKSRYPLEFQEAKAAFEREFFTNVLRKFNGNVSFTAEETSMSRRNLHLKIIGLGIDVERLRH
jgi:DNA-binding NtrC family response regulator